MLVHVLSAACAKAKYSIREGSLLLYEVMSQVPFNCEHNEDFLQNDLILLAYSLTNRPFTFTVCGFYEIDYSLMFAMIGSIAYYVVILIQLK